jgi:hypothetical protein
MVPLGHHHRERAWAIDADCVRRGRLCLHRWSLWVPVVGVSKCKKWTRLWAAPKGIFVLCFSDVPHEQHVDVEQGFAPSSPSLSVQQESRRGKDGEDPS